MIHIVSILLVLFFPLFNESHASSYEEHRAVHTGAYDKEEISELDADPLEAINRPIFAFNNVVNGVLLDPAAIMYKNVVPNTMQESISSVLGNTMEPITILNDCLQAQGNKALESFCRFLINTTFGIFGIFDVAKHLGLPAHKETFNTTLKYWGMPQGPYIVLPILGPASPRFIVGMGVDYFADPFNYYFTQNDEAGLSYTRTGLRFLTTRAEMIDDIKNFEKTSLDFYAAMRSFYIQYMNANRTGETVEYQSPSLKEFMFDD